MDIDWNAELLDQLEWHWDNQLRPRLNGLTDDEYLWQPTPKLLDPHPPRREHSADAARRR